ncbi:ABC transporter permease [Streptomyces sp. NPDC002643]
MTTAFVASLTTSATPARALARTTLRLHRPALLVWALYVLAMAGWLLWLRFVTLPAVREEVARCRITTCIDIAPEMTYSTGVSMVSTFIAYVGYAVAAWAGASLTGRELERGTARLSWTQSVTPTGWLTARLAVPAAVLTLGMTALVLLFRSAWPDKKESYGYEWWYPEPMVSLGPLAVAYVLCGLAVGALAGLVLKRALPALAVATGVMIVFHTYLDDHTADLWPLPEGARTHPLSDFWPLHLMATGVVLTVTALATAIAFWLLRRRTAR